MRIDSHQHFWRHDPVEYPWISSTTMGGLRRDFLPAHLAQEMAIVGLQASVAVQARQSLEESRWLLALADESAHVAGVVGWVDLRSGRVEEQLSELASHPKFVGVRHVVQDEPDDTFILGSAFQQGISRLRQFGLAYDVLIYPRQLPAAIELVRAFPEQHFVLDHLAKPPIRAGARSPWAEQILELSKAENVWCKVSGMVTEASWDDWTQADFRPYLDVVFESFGPRRLMFGSDWPVCLCAATYAEVHGIVEAYVQSFSPTDQQAVFGGNAAAFYRLAEAPQRPDQESAL